MKLRRGTAFLLSVLTGFASMASAQADHGPSGLVLIRGHVTDPYGRPLFACVGATHEAMDVHGVARAVTGLSDADDDHVEPTVSADGYVYTNPDGSYTLAVPPGTYELQAAAASSSTTTGRSCNSSGTWPVVTKTVNTLTDAGPTNFVVPYNVRTDIRAGDFSAVTPGGTIKVFLGVWKTAGDASATWTDLASGTVVPMVRENTSYGEWIFRGTFAVPADRPDGEYGSRFDVTVPGVSDAAEQVTQSYFVDSVAPSIAATYPADGATNIRPGLSPTFWAEDGGSGVSCVWGNTVRIYRVEGTAEHRVGNFTVMNNFLGGCHAQDRFQLEAGKSYRAEFVAEDDAGHTSVVSARFSVGDGPLFSNPSPGGVVRGPVSRIEVTGDTGIDTRWVRFTVSRLVDGRVVSSIRYSLPKFDFATRKFWIELGKADTSDPYRSAVHNPPLTPGTYRVSIAEQLDVSGNPLPSYAWEFEVTP